MCLRTPLSLGQVTGWAKAQAAGWPAFAHSGNLNAGLAVTNAPPRVDGMGRAIADVFDLPAQNRAALYREFAADSEKLAHECQGSPVRQSYLDLAAQWRDLADQIDGGGASPVGVERTAVPRSLKP